MNAPLSDLLEKHREVVKGATPKTWEVEYDSDVVDVDYGPEVRWPWRIAGVCNFTEEFNEGLPHEPIASHIATADPEVMAAYIDGFKAFLGYWNDPSRQASANDDHPVIQNIEAALAALTEVLQRKLGAQ